MKKFRVKKPQYEYLRRKWASRHKRIQENILSKHLKKIALGSLGGLVMLSTPNLPTPVHTEHSSKVEGVEDKNALLKIELLDKVPTEMRVLSAIEEKRIEEVLSKDLKMKIKSEIDGKRLNRTYGVIGGEQHLYRYPGDRLELHAKTTQDWAMFSSSGIAPGLGAWGYFSPSKQEFTEKDEACERWYLAVQTFLAPGFAERVSEYRDFYKFRKMLVVNPKTGQAVVAVIGDAGPADWTGKHLGGSPEVMHELGLAGGPRKGPVLYFFVDDPEDKIPLGPISIAEEEQFIRT